MRNFISRLLKVSALTGAVMLGWIVLSRPAPSSTPAVAPAPVPVVTAVVKREDVPIVLEGLGTVQALNVATINSQVAGLLERVDFTEGQTVKRGDVLAQIDPRLYQARLEQAQAQLARDQAQEANVKINLGRNEPLLQRGYATEQQVTDQKAQVDQLQSTLKADQAAIDDAKTELDFATLRAPFDGVTGILQVDIGNVIRPADPGGVVTLTQVQPISVVFTLPAADIPPIQAALARGPVAAIVYDQGGTKRLDTGSLLLINNQANPTSGTVQLKANFPNAQRQLWPGTFVNAEITTSVVKEALTIPADAVQQNDKGQFVYVIGADSKVAIKAVEVGQRERGTALIAKGLDAGETVVVQGQYRLVAGTLVKASSPGNVPNTSTASAGMLP